MAVRRWGAEEQVNPVWIGEQGQPVMAALPGGGLVIAWVDGSDPNRSEARYQVYDSSGLPVTPVDGFAEISGSFSKITISTLPDGGFVIACEALVGTQRIVQAWWMNAGGILDGTTKIGETGGQITTAPVLAPMGTGFLSVRAQDGDLLATWYDAMDGGPVGAITVNAGTLGLQAHADIAMLAQGGFVAVWTDLYLGRINFRVFAADGSPLESEDRQANSTSLRESEGIPSVAALSGGGFVAVWDANAASGDPDVRARLFTVTGVPLGPDFIVNTAIGGAQGLPQVVDLRGGGFAVLWIDRAGEPTIRGQIFDAWGLRVGAEFLVNTSALPPDLSPGDLSLAELADGRIAVSWRGLDDDGSGVFRQIFDPRDGVVTGTAVGETLWGSDILADEISGFGGHDTLWGLRDEDALFGGDGNDLLLGGRGDDALYGNRGNDILSGGAGADDLIGGSGLDVASYGGAVAVTLALDGSLAATGTAAGDQLLGIEGIEGSDLADRLRGDGLANLLKGGAGADNLEGQAGDDSLMGGLGADDFVFLSTLDSAADDTRDRIGDFERGLDDLVLTAIDANTALSGNQAFVLDANGSFSRGEIRQVVVSAGLRVDLNTDADATPEMSVLLLGLTANLAAGDFVL